MATVTGYTAQRMKQIEDKAIIDGNVVGNNLILVAKDGTTQDAGNVRGPQGVKGDTGEVSQAQLDAKTGVSTQGGQDLILGADGKPYFDHDTKYVDHIPKFADSGARNIAIPSPVNGQMAVVGGQLCMYDTIFASWISLQHEAKLCVVELTTTFTIPNDADGNIVPFNNVVINVGNYWNATNKAFIAPKDGWYRITYFGCISFASNVAGGNMWLSVWVNSTQYRYAQFQGDCATLTHTGTRDIWIAAGGSVTGRVTGIAPGVSKSVPANFSELQISALSYGSKNQHV